MRSLLCIACLFATSSVSLADQRRSERPDYLVGQLRVAGDGILVDFGFAYGLREGLQLAVFRSDNVAWNPVGTVALGTVGATRSTARAVKGRRPKTGDIVVVAQDSVPFLRSDLRDRYFISSLLARSQNRDGYDTRRQTQAVKALFAQRDQGITWYRNLPQTQAAREGDGGLRVRYGVTGERYQSDRISRLVSQCSILREVGREQPTALLALTPRWVTVAPIVAPKVAPIAAVKLTAEEQKDKADQQVEEARLITNLRREIDLTFASEPLAVRELLSVTLAAAIIGNPLSERGFLRSRFRRSQFPRLAEQREFIDSVLAFLAERS